ISRARSAQMHWGGLEVKERCDYMRDVREIIVDQLAEIRDLICAETGKPSTEALVNEILVAAETIEYYLHEAPRALGSQKVSTGLLKTKRAWKSYSPLGVVGVISPWNYPFTLTMTPVITALFAGNTVVLKPSEVTSLVGLKVGEVIAKAGYPDIVKVVTGDGVTGSHLVSGGLDGIAFTGSVATGRKVAVAAAEQLIPCLLELGGKDPMIVCEDADLDRAANAAVWGAFTNAGQTCISVERVYVHQNIYDSFVDKVVARTSKLQLGTDVGSMTFRPQIEKVEAHVADAIAKGATILTGGKRAEIGSQVEPNMYYEPTVLVDVDHDMDIMRDETFGPVLPIMKVSSEDEALRMANDTQYGLSASVFSKSAVRRRRIASEINAGSVSINDCLVSYAVPSLPFGGMKESGLGRAHGTEGLYGFCKVKGVAEDIAGLKSDPQWFPKRSMIESVVSRFMAVRYRQSIASKLKGLTGSNGLSASRDSIETDSAGT
ncbi:MAG TPA: aldehyde dehydrogenase family protein, partial [Acidimicrobiales bacterium]|nr:aldehyde dehydrogenase family protein [Acidimicrobiales bacterium]